MNNSHDEIKKLLKASRTMLSSNNSLHESNDIKKQYGMLLEADSVFKKINVAKAIEKKFEDDEMNYEGDNKEYNSKRDKSVTFRISGGLLKINGKSTKELQLTEDEKMTFQETMDEFVSEVSNLVDFTELNIYPQDVTWGGTLNDFNLTFDYRIGEENGVYFKVDNLTKLSKEIMDAIKKIENYYKKFKSKWATILGNRKMTKLNNND